jgi:hypothetical protein
MPIELSHDLISGIIGTGAGLAVKYSFNRTQEVFVKARLVKLAWSFLLEKTHVFVPISEVPNGAAGGYGDLLALSRLLTLADTYFKNNQLRVHTDSREFNTSKMDNLVVIGGGKYNPVFRELVGELNIPLHFFDTATASFREIRNQGRSIVYSPEYSDSGVLTKDIGLAVHARNPNSDNRTIVIVAGSHTYGSVAAMEYLAHQHPLREIKRFLGHNVEVVVSGDVASNNISNIKRVSQIITW